MKWETRKKRQRRGAQNELQSNKQCKNIQWMANVSDELKICNVNHTICKVSKIVLTKVKKKNEILKSCR